MLGEYNSSPHLKHLIKSMKASGRESLYSVSMKNYQEQNL